MYIVQIKKEDNYSFRLFEDFPTLQDVREFIHPDIDEWDWDRLVSRNCLFDGYFSELEAYVSIYSVSMIKN